MYDANLVAALRALVPPLYYAWGCVNGGDGLVFTREAPPPGAAPVGTTENVAASLAAHGDEQLARQKLPGIVAEPLKMRGLAVMQQGAGCRA